MTPEVTNRLSNDVEPDPAVCDPSVCCPAEPDSPEPELSGAFPLSAPASDVEQQLDPDYWRREVAARLERYRTRRKPKAPRYPSLLLPFDAPEYRPRYTVSSTAPAVEAAVEPIDQQGEDFAFAGLDTNALIGDSVVGDSKRVEGLPEYAPEVSAKVIEFPRSAAIPVSYANELAEPVADFDRPRIVEAPEVLPPPPALGGILIETAQQRPETEQDASGAPASASIVRRVLAAALDGFIIALTLAATVAIFLRFNPSLIPNARPDRATVLLIAGVLSAAAIFLALVFQYAFVVYTGSTPGLVVARLRLAGLDGSPLNRRRRRWRVLASFLSAFSLGLGYIWSCLDENALSWHDRITHTHIRNR